MQKVWAHTCGGPLTLEVCTRIPSCWKCFLSRVSWTANKENKWPDVRDRQQQQFQADFTTEQIKIQRAREKCFIKWEHFRGNAADNVAMLLPAVKLYHCPQNKDLCQGNFHLMPHALLFRQHSHEGLAPLIPPSMGANFMNWRQTLSPAFCNKELQQFLKLTQWYYSKGWRKSCEPGSSYLIFCGVRGNNKRSPTPKVSTRKQPGESVTFYLLFLCYYHWWLV